MASIGYDSRSQILEIEFNGGKLHEYNGVPEGAYASLIAADSHGIYFNAHVKNGYTLQSFREMAPRIFEMSGRR